MSRAIEIRPGVWAHCSGALWLSEAAVVLVADAHLGYGWAQRRRGELGPLADEVAIEKLDCLREELAPRTIVFLGDLVHAPRPSRHERNLIEGSLARLAQQADLVLVRGNHDRGFPADFGHLPIRLATQWESNTAGGVLAIHGDRLPEQAAERLLILGHLHPSLRIEDAAGAGRRIPVFAAGERAVIVPAFSPFAAGWNLRKGLPAAWRPYFGSGSLFVIGVSGKRAVRLPDLPASRIFS